MTNGPKVALAALGALALYLVFGSKPAAAAEKPAVTVPKPGTILAPPTAPPAAFPPPSPALAPGFAAVYAVIVRTDASAAPWGPFEVAQVPVANATNAGYLVDQVNHSPVVTPAPLPTEAVQVFTVDGKGTVLYAFAFQGGTTVTPVSSGVPYTIVGYTSTATPDGTLAAAALDTLAKTYAPQVNGTADGSVQRAAALLAATSDGNTQAAVYDASGNIAIDPKYGTIFVVAPGGHDS